MTGCETSVLTKSKDKVEFYHTETQWSFSVKFFVVEGHQYMYMNQSMVHLESCIAPKHHCN